MIVIGYGQLLAGILLVLSGWFLAAPPNPTHPIFGAVCLAYGLLVIHWSFVKLDPPGV